MQCKIGLISKSSDSVHDCFLNLGEIFDKSIHDDRNILYELHTNLRYLRPFTAQIDGKNAVIDNIEEISIFQNHYKLTRKCWIDKTMSSCTVNFLSPQLYDITCMIPLFSDTIPKSICYDGNTEPARVFMLFPYSNPIMRGKIIDNCFSIAKKYKSYFFVIGSKKGYNSKKYLLSCGVEDKNIICNQYDTFPDCILESLNMIKFMVPDTDMKIFIAVCRKDMNRVMSHIRLYRKTGLINIKLELICN